MYIVDKKWQLNQFHSYLVTQQNVEKGKCVNTFWRHCILKHERIQIFSEMYRTVPGVYLIIFVSVFPQKYMISIDIVTWYVNHRYLNIYPSMSDRKWAKSTSWNVRRPNNLTCSGGGNRCGSSCEGDISEHTFAPYSVAGYTRHGKATSSYLIQVAIFKAHCYYSCLKNVSKLLTSTVCWI